MMPVPSPPSLSMMGIVAAGGTEERSGQDEATFSYCVSLLRPQERRRCSVAAKYICSGRRSVSEDAAFFCVEKVGFGGLGFAARWGGVEEVGRHFRLNFFHKPTFSSSIPLHIHALLAFYVRQRIMAKRGKRAASRKKGK